MSLAQSAQKTEDLPAKVAQQQAQIRWLELRVKDLETQLFGKKSEKRSDSGDDGNLQWDALLGEVRALAPVPAQPPTPVTATGPSRKTGLKKGPKPLDPALPREVIAVPAPDLKDLICPETGRAMQAAFVEVLEVLARKPAVYFVKRYERTVFTSPAKTAPVYGPWPQDVLPRSRVHASIVAHIAAMHFCEHQPYYRLEKQLERLGVDLPRVCRVSLMAQLEEHTRPLVGALKDYAGASREDVAARMRALAASLRGRDGQSYSPLPFRYNQPVEDSSESQAETSIRQLASVFGLRILFVDTKEDLDLRINPPSRRPSNAVFRLKHCERARMKPKLESLAFSPAVDPDTG